MSQYNYGLSLLLAGVDNTGAHVYRLDNPGRMEVYDSLGYCAVGSGELHAISTFVANDYRHDLDLDHVLALTYEAKRRSEKAQGVGEKSDIYIVTKDNCLKLSDEEIKKLDNIYNMKSEQEKKAVKEIEDKIKELKIIENHHKKITESKEKSD